MALTPPFADADDLAARWRPLSVTEAAKATVLLTDASQIILDEDRYGTLADLTTPTLTLVRIVCAMVKRAMLAGSTDDAPVSQTQQTAGPFSISATYSNPTGDLYLTAAERRALGFSRQRAGHVDMFETTEA